MAQNGAAVVVMALATAACKNTVDTAPIATSTVCGPQTADDARLRAPADTLLGSAGTATGVSQGTRVFAWDFLVRDLCTTAPSTDNVVNFRVSFADTLPTGTAVVGLIYYVSAPTALPRVVTLTRAPVFGYVEYRGQIAGIIPAPDTSGVLHADLITGIQISFPTRGSTTADRALLQPLLTLLEVTTYYHPFIGT